MNKKLGYVLTTAAASVMLAGCSGSVSVGGSGIDQQKLQDEITANVKSVVPSVQDVAVTCPSDIALAKGTSFNCTAAIGDQDLTVKVTQTDDEGNVEYTQDQALLDLDKLQRELNAGLAKQVGGSWTTTCDSLGSNRYRVGALGSDFKCYTTGKSAEGVSREDLPVVVTVKDVDGNVSWRAQD